MIPGIAKTDAIDAEVIARTAMGMPRALGPIAAEDAAARSLRALSSQRERVGGVREGRRRGRGRPGAHAGARDIRAGLRRRRARRAHRRGAGRRRGRREPARDTRHRAEDRRGAGHRGRHLAVREPPRAGGLPRGGARRQRVRHRHKVNLPAARGQQAAREPADIQLQPPRRDEEPVRKALRRAQGEGGMGRNKALKAVARKRMEVVYAIMRDAVPYEPRR